MGSVFWITKDIVLDRFQSLETQLIERDLGRLDAALKRESDALLMMNIDWSQWDDTYLYMASLAPEYEASNIEFSTFKNLDVMAILFLDNEYKIKKQFSYNSETEEMYLIHQTFLQSVSELHRSQFPNQSFAGLFTIENKIYMLASHPILNSDASGPARGNLVFIRLFSEKIITKLAQQTFLKLECLSIDTFQQNQQFNSIKNNLKNEKHNSIIHKNEIIGISRIDDVLEQPILFFLVPTPRSIYQQGLDVFQEFTIMLTLAGLAFAVLVLFTLRHVILERLHRLSQSLIEIGTNAEYGGQRVLVKGDDEIGLVAAASNKMLDSLETTFNQRQKDHERQRTQNNLLICLAKEHAIVEGDIETISQKITDAMLVGCQIDRASIWLFDESMSHFICIDYIVKTTKVHGANLTLNFDYLRQIIGQLRHTGSIKIKDATSLANVHALSGAFGSPQLTGSVTLASVKFKGQLHGFIFAEKFQTSSSQPIDEEVFLISAADFIEQTIAAKERKQLESELWRLASYDNLTGIPNRSFFYRCLADKVDNSKNDPALLALFFIDLDKFKPVNDTFGHSAGDQLLKQVAIRIRLVIRDDDVLARIGGDEFTVLLTKLKNADDAKRVAEKIIQNVSNPYYIESHLIRIGCSIGIAMCPDDATSSEELTSMADSAMYHAKQTGRNKVVMYNEKDNIKTINN